MFMIEKEQHFKAFKTFFWKMYMDVRVNEYAKPHLTKKTQTCTDFIFMFNLLSLVQSHLNLFQFYNDKRWIGGVR